jgi:phosphoribosylglycinamide formyltransferase 1
MIRIAIFASGSGTNAENIVQSFKTHSEIRVELILTNNSSAYVIERSKSMGIDCVIFTREDLNKNKTVENLLQERKVDWIILAGFLWLIPASLIQKYPDRIINIHPALLPAYGGKGMYGQFVHEAVIANGESKSGITIHLVNEEYDKGIILYQAECDITKDDTSDSLAKKIHQLEYTYFPRVIEKAILGEKV